MLLHFILRQQSREDVVQHWCLSVSQGSCHNSHHVCYFSQCIGVSVSHLCYGVCWGVVAVLLLLLLALIRVKYSLMNKWIFSCPRRCRWHDVVKVFCFYQIAAELFTRVTDVWYVPARCISWVYHCCLLWLNGCVFISLGSLSVIMSYFVVISLELVMLSIVSFFMP